MMHFDWQKESDNLLDFRGYLQRAKVQDNKITHFI